MAASQVRTARRHVAFQRPRVTALETPERLTVAEAKLNAIVSKLSANAIETIEDILATEATTQAALRAEDQGWVRPAGSQTATDYTFGELVKLRKRSRALWLVDGTIKSAERLLLSGSVGRGILKPKAGQALQETVDEFFNDPDNQLSVFSPQAIEQLNLAFMLDGEVFIACNTTAADHRVKMHLIPANEITEVVTHPDNPSRVIAYQRTYKPEWFNWSTGKREFSQQSVVAYYRDIETPDPFGTEATEDPEAARVLAQCPALLDDVCIMQVRVNTTGLRGVPLVARAIEWARAHHRCVTDLVCYTRAITAIAWIKKALTRSQSAFAASAAVGVDSPAGPGATYTTSGSTDIQSVNVSTAGTNVLETACRMTFLQVIRCFPFAETWYGDVSRGSYATAQSVELPAMWGLRYWQNSFRGPFLRLIRFAVDRAIDKKPDLNIGGQSRNVDIEFPRPEPRDDSSAPNLILAITNSAIEGALPWREASRQILESLGVTESATIIEEQFGDGDVPKYRLEQQAAAQAVAAASPQSQQRGGNANA